MKKIIFFMLIAFFLSTTVHALTPTPGDISAIRNLVNKYEEAYQNKDISGMVRCVDKRSQWYQGLEKNMKAEFDKFKYIRIYSTEKGIEQAPDKNLKNRDDLPLMLAHRDSPL